MHVCKFKTKGICANKFDGKSYKEINIAILFTWHCFYEDEYFK